MSAELESLNSLLEEAKSKSPEIQAGELVAAAEQIMGVVDEAGEIEIPGLMNMPKAVQLLAEIRIQLDHVLQSSQDWKDKGDQQAELKKIADRLMRAEEAFEVSQQSRIIRKAG